MNAKFLPFWSGLTLNDVMSQLLRKFYTALLPSFNGFKTYKYQQPGQVVTKTDPNAVERYLWKSGAYKWRINKTRCYFPRPNELQRIRRHGWEARMSTYGGRKVLMSRILKGRHVLSH